MNSIVIMLSTAHEMYRHHDFSGYDLPLVDTRNAVAAAMRPTKYHKA